LPGKGPRYAAEAARALHSAFTNALGGAGEDLDRPSVVRALDAISRRRARQRVAADRTKGAAMMGRTAAYGHAAFSWAVKRGMVQTNPFAAVPVSKVSPKRERVLSDDEIAEIWRAASATNSSFGAIVRLLILTGQRRGEVAGLSWRELSDDLATWTIPGDRTKNGAAHVVPLSAPARDLVRATLPSDAVEAARLTEDRRAGGALLF